MKTPHKTLEIPHDPTPWVLVSSVTSKTWAVLWLQGWEGAIEGQYDTLSRLAAASEIPFAMIDYAGHGVHPTPLAESTREQQHLEVVAAYDALKAKGYQNIIAVGYSFGGYMAALLANKRELAAILLRAPAIYDDREFMVKQKDRDDTFYQQFKKTVTPTSKLAALTAIKNFKKPVYVIEHEKDEVIPSNIPRSYFSLAKHGNYIVIPGAVHTPNLHLLPQPRRYYNYIEAATLNILQLIILEKDLPR